MGVSFTLDVFDQLFSVADGLFSGLYNILIIIERVGDTGNDVHDDGDGQLTYVVWW